MSRTMSRTAFGLAAISLGLGYSLSTTAVWADTVDGTSATYSYTCTDQDDSTLTETMDINVWVGAQPEAEVGQEVQFQVEPDDYNYYMYTSGGEITEGTLTAEVQLGGEAAPSATASAEIDASGPFGENNEETFDETALTGTFTPTAPGEITVAPGNITIYVNQSMGPSTTVCVPDVTTDALATVTVTGEAVPTEAPTDTATEDSGAEAPPSTGAAEEGGQTMIVIAAVVVGVILIGAIAMIGLLVYFMRRS
ncbi:hypothetical protein LG943_14315 [Streptomonospora sp. S1-112]|uniref:Uncharacterized protein n=1 Tax=Streptomonospora mangrovi TaxID=2883123 RepID=A0A9X3SP43_9ACTN|nr:hypothetical protein [Streptomonospora mangrovi]MDA0565481.1 hypothetical protein [Streptomonospora mangrovi]